MEKMKNSDSFFEEFGRIDDIASSDNIIPKKYKELTMITISVMTKCEECVLYHIQECIKAEASISEIIEALKMGIICGGSTSYPYVRYAFKVLIDLNLLD